MRGDGGVDQIAAQPAQPRQRAILVRPGEPGIADHVGNQDRRNFPGLAHRASPSRSCLAQRLARSVKFRHGPHTEPRQAERPQWVGSGHSAKGSSRYVMVNAKVFLDSTDAHEVIDFFREARNIPRSDFKRVEPKTDVFELGLNVCEPIAHLNA